MTNKCKRGILISKTPYEKRFAIMEDGELAELVVEGMSTDQILGNIYKGIVKKVVPGSKLAYVDIGLGVDGVLYQDDVVDRKTSLNRSFDDDDDKAFDNAAIEKVLREGDEIMVQVTKEPAGNKGAVLTMRLLFAGSLLVCMPGTNFIGVSKRERDQAKRSETKRLINRLKGRDVGYIVRTEGMNASEADLQQQMRCLEEKWARTKDNFENGPVGSCIYEESDSTQRAIGEYFNENTDYVYIDNRDEYFTLRDHLREVAPDMLDKVKLWSSNESLFEYFKIENDYARSLQRQVPLPRGGNLVIEQTEALMSIDVNTGPKVHGKDQGKIILETNIDACREIAKQLRLRDVDGIVIIDFIDMETDADRETVYQEFCKVARRDKAEVSPSPISQFGLMEVTRRRIRETSGKTHFCPVCYGGGRIATLESSLGMIDRWMARAHAKGNLRNVTLVVSAPLVEVLVRDRARMLHYLEFKHGMKVELIEDDHAQVNQFWMFNSDKEDITDLYNFAEMDKADMPSRPPKRRNERGRNKVKREILISKTPYEKRIAIMEDGELAELVVESVSSTRVLGNIYKGVVQKVLPALKAAFIDIGMEKAGFLHQDDAMDRNELLRREYGDDDDEGGPSKEISIDNILREGQEIMVQVVKEPISTKGARLTTHLSFAGRFLVCMPGTNFIGVSKRERDPAKRREFKKVVRRLKARDVGYIVRTNGLIESEFEIQKQMRELESKWEQTKFNFANQPAETCIYEESDSIEQTVREYFGENTDYVYIDNREEYLALRDYLKVLSPDKLNKVKLWNKNESLFEHFKIENDYARSLQRRIPLYNGGNLVIEQTEALVSIDVNMGKNRGKDMGKFVLETNLFACREIAKQLRLRDVGGLIIIKFLTMNSDADREAVFQEFRKAIRRDKAPISPAQIGQFGVMEVTRKRVRVNLMTEKTELCPICRGGGRIATLESTLGMIDRWMARASTKGRMREVTLVVSTSLVDELCKNDLNIYRYLESKHNMKINLVEDDYAHENQFWMYDKNKEDITDLYNNV